jgi:hypothetical protein
MADERLKKDANYYPVVGGLTDDIAEDILMIRLNPATKRLLVDVTSDIGTIMFLSGYFISDKDDDASPNYFGFVDRDGNWYILKETVLAGADTYRYAKGTTGYTTNWTGRAALSYDYFYNVFP